MGIRAKLYELPNVTMTFPDNSAPITNIHAAKVKRFPSYYKVTVFGDKSWSIRVKDAASAAAIVGNTFEGWYEISDGIYSTAKGTAPTDVLVEIKNLPIYADDEPVKKPKDFGKVIEDEINEVTNSKKKENNTMNQINVINGAITFEKELAFAVNGKYVAISKDGVRKEVLPQFLIAKDIPALIPTVADKITAGTFYSNGGKLYKAVADNKVIDLDTGIVAEIAVASIPMTDKVIVYKPVIGGDGKVGFKDIMKAQMLGKMGGDNNPFMMMAMLGDGDMNTDDLLMMSMMNGGKGIDNNALLPLMLLKGEGKDEGSSMEDLLLLQAASGKAADANALTPLLMMKMLKGEKKAKKAD